jgi:hypothetical protein
MDQSTGHLVLHEGEDVYGSDGHKVGRIFEVYPTYFVVEKGFFFPTDYFIPKYAVARSENDRVYLNVTKGDALHRGWDVPPEEHRFESGTVNHDASGTASYAAARESMVNGMGGDAATSAAAAIGLTNLMGESDTTPGLAGDLTQDRPEAASSASNDPDETAPDPRT